MNVSLRQLKAFLLIARLGNFTRAAERLYVTQAGLSVMMRELEAQLDSRLFDRTTRAVTLTAAGRKLLPAALTAVGEIEGAAAQISDIGEKARQTLRVAATPLVSSNLLPTVCRSFRIRHPEVTIRLVDCDLKQVHTLVETGEVDFGLGFFFQAARGIERSLLYSFQLMRVAPLDDALAGETIRAGGTGTMPWSELDDTPLIGLPPDNPIQQLVETHLAKIGRSNEDRLTFSHFDTLIAMVAAGMGTAIIPAFAMLACRRHRVRTDLLTDPEVTLGFFRITKRGRGKADSMTDFTDTLTSLLPSLVQA
jgi:DNA-binding transcriptional LysR family regulator